MESSRDAQLNALASIVPQVMNAIGGGHPEISRQLEKQRAGFQEQQKANNTRSFMRAVAAKSTGEITPELIMEMAAIHHVVPEDAMRVVMAFSQFRKANAPKQQDPFTLSPGQQRFDGAGNPIASMPGAAPKPVAMPTIQNGIPGTRFVNPRVGDFFASPPTKQDLVPIPTFDANGVPGTKFVERKKGAFYPKPTTGMDIEVGADGVTRVSTGVARTPNQITKKTMGNTEQKLLQANATYSDMKATYNQTKDKFLLKPTQFANKLTALKESWGVGNVSEQDKAELSEYTSWKRNAISSLNNYIKEITGAAMSAEEAKRLMKGMPNPGVGLFDGDSPTEFSSKMGDVMKALDRSIARYHYVLNNGLSDYKSVPLEKMGDIIDEQGAEFEAKIIAQNPDAKPDEVNKLVLEELAKYFGLRF